MRKSSDDFQRLNARQLSELLQNGGPEPGERAWVLDDGGNTVAVLMSPQEYQAILAFMKLASDPERVAVNRDRIQKIGRGLKSSRAEFFGHPHR